MWELKVTNKLEDELKGIVGIKQMISALENNSIIEIDIDAADEEKVKTEIREAVSRAEGPAAEVTGSQNHGSETSLFRLSRSA